MPYEVVSHTELTRARTAPQKPQQPPDKLRRPRPEPTHLPSPATHAITAHGIRKSFGSTEVLRGIDLSVPRGTLLALLGPNGAGKTTIVRILSTLMRPDAGNATVGGHDVVTDADKVHRILGLTGQFTAVDGLLTGHENLMMIGRLNHLRRREARQRVNTLLEQFDLRDAAGRPANTYSGGMRRRLDLAASLIGNPSVVFLDEPTTGLDPRARQGLWEIVRDLLANGTTILLTTQYLEEADQLADRVAVIDAGRIVAEGSPQQLKQDIGAERAVLTFDPSEIESAWRTLDRPGIVTDRQRTQVSVQIEAPGQLRDLLNQLDAEGLEPATLSVTRPTLDDVFLNLTESGHRAGDDIDHDTGQEVA